MNDRGKSDSPVVPAKPPNKPGRPGAEVVEGRGLPKGNAASKTRPGRRAGQGAPSALARVRRIAKEDKDAKFTALLHHVDVDRLRAAYFALRPKAAPGVDGVTWHEYGLDLDANLRDLHRRVHCGSYRAKPVRRAYIPKRDGRLRPLGVDRYRRRLACESQGSRPGPCARKRAQRQQGSGERARLSAVAGGLLDRRGDGCRREEPSSRS